jgi:alcohol dehydrogenase
MRQLMFLAPGRLEWADAPEPRLESPDDALVRPLAVALCDADVANLRGEFQIPGPFPMGHEFVAEVTALGEHVRTHHVGDRVALPVQISCGRCSQCRRGMTASCRGVPQPAAWGLGALGGHWPGAFCDLLRVPFAEHMMVAVPPDVDPRVVASAGDNLSDAWRTVAPHLQESPGAEVLIVGHGSIGLYAVAIAHALGASCVDYVDPDEEGCILAARLGARPLGCTLGERAGSYPITVDASFRPNGMLTAVRSLAPGGVCTVAFPGVEDRVLPLMEMWMRGTRLHVGVANARAHMPAVLDLVQAGKVRPEQITTEVIAWDDAAEALAEPSRKPLVVREPLRW